MSLLLLAKALVVSDLQVVIAYSSFLGEGELLPQSSRLPFFCHVDLTPCVWSVTEMQWSDLCAAKDVGFPRAHLPVGGGARAASWWGSLDMIIPASRLPSM